MFNFIQKIITGLDDVERVAQKGDIQQLRRYLSSRPLLFPKRPLRYLDPSCSEEELEQLIREEAEATSAEDIQLWVLDVDGEKRLPAFTSAEKVQAFTSHMVRDLDKIFSVGCVEALFPDITSATEVDFVDLNVFSPKSWEIETRT